MTHYRDRYEEIYSLLTRAELQQGSKGLEEISAGPELFGYDNEKWLGFYTRDGLRIALRKYGFFRDLERLGFQDFRIETNTDNPDEHLFRLWSRRPAVDEPLIELVVRRDFLRPHSELADRLVDTHIPVLTVDWLLMQNPRASFTAERPPLPGQVYPGLGVGAQVLEMLRNVCKRLELAGITTVPSYFHNAQFYSEEFRHFDPHWQGAFLALSRDLMPKLDNSVAAATWALNWEMVCEKGDETPFPWFHQLMVNPLSPLLEEYFEKPSFHADVQQSLRSHAFDVFERPLQNNLRARGIAPFDPDKIDDWIEDNTE